MDISISSDAPILEARSQTQIMKRILFGILLAITTSCKKGGEEPAATVNTPAELTAVGTWDAIYFTNKNYSVGARFEAPKGLTITFLSNGTFSTTSIPHIPNLNLSGKYVLNADKSIVFSEVSPTGLVPIMFINRSILNRIEGLITFTDRPGGAFIANYELVKRN